VAAPGRARREAEAVRITTAPTSHGEELDRRRRRYVISMAIRTLCFVGAIVVGDIWVRWVLVAGAFVLPYVAVVMANTEGRRQQGADLMPPGQSHKELGP
jgi:hypothetical protein